MVTHTIEHSAGTRIHRLQWKNRPLDDEVFAALSTRIKRSTDYASMDRSRESDLKMFLRSVNKRFNANATLDQIFSARNILIKDKIVKNYARMNKNIEKIAIEYDQMDILDLSSRYDLPPLNLLRGIFIQKRYPSGVVYNIFANKADPTTLLHGRDLLQYKLACKYDAESIINQQAIAEAAARNEARAVKYFKQLGINLRTQEDLVRAQTEKYGRPVITPDVLFDDPVYINGTRVHWIDYKDYVGTPVHFLQTSNVNQATRYNEKWGPGAIVYRYAYVEGLIIPDTLLLDGRDLPVNFE